MAKIKDALPDFRNGVNRHPHVVILGAGASLAACPKGDKYGRRLPLMNSLVPTLGLVNILKGHEPLFNDFENLYTKLSEDRRYESQRAEVEKRTYDYFYNMQIPDAPTLYDYLILSLRKKDVIATFNWDPLLMQAWRRHTEFLPDLPMILFLHGNVATGTCKKCGDNGYMYAHQCGGCGHYLDPVRLLYPISNKEYDSDPFIKRQWSSLYKYLEGSYYVTIFGYSGPKTDVEARKLMLTAIKANRSKVFTELDIIDKAPKQQVEENWREFFYSHHYGIDRYLKKNHLLYHPRRSCEAHASAYLMNDPWGENRFPYCRTIAAMHKWVKPLIEEERTFEYTGKGFKPT